MLDGSTFDLYHCAAQRAMRLLSTIVPTLFIIGCIVFGLLYFFVGSLSLLIHGTGWQLLLGGAGLIATGVMLNGFFRDA